MPDTLEPERVGPLLRGHFGTPYLYTRSCGSTQSLLGAALPEGAVAVAEHQTAGRGRRGRRWETPAGDAILCSVLVRPPATRPLPQLGLVGGVAVALALERATGLACQVKWPNDVLVGGYKIAGVLAEGRSGHVVLGFGINVNQDHSKLPADARTPAASLLTLDGLRRERAPLLVALLDAFEELYRAWVTTGLDAVRPQLVARDFLAGRRVDVDGRAATAIGIAPDGRLEVAFGVERVLLSTGEITAAG